MKLWGKIKKKTGSLFARFVVNSTLTLAVAGYIEKLFDIMIYFGELTNCNYEMYFLKVVQN